MADPRPWVKFWKCWLSDPDTRTLSWADRGRWATLFLLVGEHGHDGRWTLRNGVTDLPDAWRRGRTPLQSLDAIRRLPGFVLILEGLPDRKDIGSPPEPPDLEGASCTKRDGSWTDFLPKQPPQPPPSQAFTVHMPNWHKYQVDSSAVRTRRWRGSPVTDASQRDDGPRQAVTMQDVEEKRRDNPPTPRSLNGRSIEAWRREEQTRLMHEHPEWSARHVEDAALEAVQQMLNSDNPQSEPPVPF